MKILMLGWELPPNNSGGLGVASYQLCKALSAHNVDIEFVLPYQPDESPSFMTVTAAYPQDVRVVQAAGLAYDSMKYTYSDGYEGWVDLFGQERLYAHAVEELVTGQEYDIIHAHDWLTFRAALKVKQNTGWPLIVHVHSVEADRAGKVGGGNPLVREIEGLGLLMADRVIAVSEHTKQAIISEYAIPADKIDVVYNSVDRSELAPLDVTTAYPYLEIMRASGYKVVTYVGRLTIQKGLTQFLKAAREVVQRYPKTLFLIVGNGDQYFELIEQAADLGILQNVIFTGFQRGKAWRDAFAGSDLFVLPSVSEPFGLTPLEAAYYGTPSLITRQSGVSEVFRNCLRVDFWDTREMANQITGAISNPFLHDELRDNAYAELDTLSWEEPAKQVADLYTSHVSEVRS